ncbi:unnamed protein product, partial [Ectocarpus sp. 6 AP-2014]
MLPLVVATVARKAFTLASCRRQTYKSLELFRASTALLLKSSCHQVHTYAAIPQTTKTDTGLSVRYGTSYRHENCPTITVSSAFSTFSQ